MSDFVELSANENLLGPSPKAMEAIQKAVLASHIYPRGEELMLREKLAAFVGGGISAENFVIGNGSGDIIRMAIQVYVLPNDEVIIPAPTFISYKRLTKIHRGIPVEIPLVDYQVDLDAVLDAITPRTKLIFLCNPNNPTGQIITHDEMGAFLAKLPEHVIVAVDEAYIDFADDPNFPNIIDYVNADHNLIVMRTFSKVYGLASLRVGYAFGKESLITPMRNTRHTADTGSLGYLGAAAALTDEAHVVDTKEMVIAERNYYYEALTKLGLKFLPSQGFYILLHDLPLDAQFIVDEVLKHNVAIRHTNFFEMPGYIRISIGRRQDNERAIAALRAVLAESGSEYSKPD